jgi:hypothetical protein
MKELERKLQEGTHGLKKDSMPMNKFKKEDSKTCIGCGKDKYEKKKHMKAEKTASLPQRRRWLLCSMPKNSTPDKLHSR